MMHMRLLTCSFCRVRVRTYRYNIFPRDAEINLAAYQQYLRPVRQLSDQNKLLRDICTVCVLVRHKTVRGWREREARIERGVLGRADCAIAALLVGFY